VQSLRNGIFGGSGGKPLFSRRLKFLLTNRANVPIIIFRADLPDMAYTGDNDELL